MKDGGIPFHLPDALPPLVVGAQKRCHDSPSLAPAWPTEAPALLPSGIFSGHPSAQTAAALSLCSAACALLWPSFIPHSQTPPGVPAYIPSAVINPLLGGTVFGTPTTERQETFSHIFRRIPSFLWRGRQRVLCGSLFPVSTASTRVPPFLRRTLWRQLFSSNRYSSFLHRFPSFYFSLCHSPGRCPAKRLHRRPFHLPPLFNISPSLAAPSSCSHTQKKPFARTSEGLLIDEKKR